MPRLTRKMEQGTVLRSGFRETKNRPLFQLRPRTDGPVDLRRWKARKRRKKFLEALGIGKPEE